ncbi:unnamed protein product [Lactuca virosa]|uniref:Uncharacterized protein n=1 Tax=Lactuca virosa TaxID=75947 RepID=A0AAU9PEY1_9ASTR|nr:unnamed protein product [Lactuca virosa]
MLHRRLLCASTEWTVGNGGCRDIDFCCVRPRCLLDISPEYAGYRLLFLYVAGVRCTCHRCMLCASMASQDSKSFKNLLQDFAVIPLLCIYSFLEASTNATLF